LNTVEKPKAQIRGQLEEDFVQFIAKRTGLSVEEAREQVLTGTYARPVPKKRRKAPPGKKGKRPETLARRIAKKLGPDDGRRGGSPTVQGGAPGLGKKS
jgi:hypothetical protein